MSVKSVTSTSISFIKKQNKKQAKEFVVAYKILQNQKGEETSAKKILTSDLKDNPDVMFQAIRLNFYVFSHIGSGLRDNKRFAIKALNWLGWEGGSNKLCIHIYNHLSTDLKSDPLVVALLQFYGSNRGHCKIDLEPVPLMSWFQRAKRAGTESYQSADSIVGNILNFCCSVYLKELGGEEDVILVPEGEEQALLAIEIDYRAVKYLNKDLQQNEKVLLKALEVASKEEDQVIQELSNKMVNTRAFWVQFTRLCWDKRKIVPDEFLKDMDFLRDAFALKRQDEVEQEHLSLKRAREEARESLAPQEKKVCK